MNLLGTVYTQTIAKRSQEWESGLVTKVYCHVGGACYCSGVQPKLTVVGEMNPDHTRLFFLYHNIALTGCWWYNREKDRHSSTFWSHHTKTRKVAKLEQLHFLKPSISVTFHYYDRYCQDSRFTQLTTLSTSFTPLCTWPVQSHLYLSK